MKTRLCGFILFLVMTAMMETSWAAYESIINNYFGAGAGGLSIGSYNLFMGYNAGYQNNGSNNSFSGYLSGANNNGDYNSFYGVGTGDYNSGSHNSFFGYIAGGGNKASYNSFFGSNAGRANTNGFYNSYFGYNAGGNNSSGFKNSYFGYQAGYNTNGNGIDNGIENSFFGSGAGYSNVTGLDNSFFGNNAGYNNTGSYNNFFGNNSGFNNTGSFNSFYGMSSGLNNTSGTTNSFFGHDAGYFNTTGSNNSSFGQDSGVSNTTGNNNTFIGVSAGYSAVGTGNVFLGYGAGYSENPANNKLIIDNCINGAPCSSPFIYGDFGTKYLTVNGTVNASNYTGDGSKLTNINVSSIANGVLTTGSYADPSWIPSLAGTKITGTVANATNAANATTCTYTSQIGSITSNYIPRWNGIQMVTGIISDNGSTATVNGTLVLSSVASISDERFKKNIQLLQLSLEKVIKLTGISYEWKTEEYSGKGFKEGRQIGLIAQEVEKVFPELVVTDDNSYKAVAYDKLVPVLIEAVKEQQESIQQKDSRIVKLEKALEMMEHRLALLENPAQKVASK